LAIKGARWCKINLEEMKELDKGIQRERLREIRRNLQGAVSYFNNGNIKVVRKFLSDCIEVLDAWLEKGYSHRIPKGVIEDWDLWVDDSGLEPSEDDKIVFSKYV